MTDLSHLATHQQLAALRVARGIKIADLARAAEMPASTISNYLQGRHDLSAKKLARLAEALGYKLALVPTP